LNTQYKLEKVKAKHQRVEKMCMGVVTGLERLLEEPGQLNKLTGNVGYLLHSASVDRNYVLGIYHLKNLLKDRLIKLIGPQHGIFANSQDNMVETQNFVHPYFKLPVLSLYSDIRMPNQETLADLDTLVIDLQDVGTRVYTYISTLGLVMQACENRDIKVVILDRPNPVGGEIIEGSILSQDYQSFVGHSCLPMRHGMTLGEVGQYFQKFLYPKCSLEVVPMKGWQRKYFFKDTGLPWVNPSPNLPTMESALTFVGTVLFEGTNISEGRGTTRSLEIIGHPQISPYFLLDKLQTKVKDWGLEGFILRPAYFTPTFQKHAQRVCGGFQIHITDYQLFRPWRLGQFLLKEFRHELGDAFSWSQGPYEYEYEKLPIDLINGNDELRQWIDSDEGWEKLFQMEREGLGDFLSRRAKILIY
jgi:uncharacterized protein YbbC (DUF1343 family)